MQAVSPKPLTGDVVHEMTNNDEVPKTLQEKYWNVFHKDNTLTFLDKDRKASKLLNFDIMKIDMLNAMPYYDYTFDKELEFGVMRNVFETKLDRAMGAPASDQKNERTMLSSQMVEQRHITQESADGKIKDSFFKRLLGRR